MGTKKGKKIQILTLFTLVSIVFLLIPFFMNRNDIPIPSWFNIKTIIPSKPLELQPANAVLGIYDPPDDPYDVAVSGDVAYVADAMGGLRCIDISDPSAPSELGYFDTPGYTYDVVVSGDVAYVADSDYGLRCIDISDPSTPSELGYFDTPS